MKVLHLYAGDGRDAAASFLLALHGALAREGVTSRVLASTGGAWKDEPGVAELDVIPRPDWTRQAVDSYFGEAPGFTFGYPGQALRAEHFADVEVVHLHAVQNLLSPADVSKLIELGKVIVWTLHDHWPMTGGCHTPNACRQFTQVCTVCPRLERDPLRMVEAAFKDRIAHFNSRIAVVAPTETMADDAHASAVFQQARIETIPHGAENLARRYASLYADLVRKPALVVGHGNGAPGPVRNLLPELIVHGAQRLLERAKLAHTDAVGQLEHEANALRQRNLTLDLEVKALRRDLRRARRNVGYRITHGITRALKALARLAAWRPAAAAPFPKPAGKARVLPCSAELRSTLDFAVEACHAVFFTSATHRNWVLHKRVTRKPVPLTCLGAAELQCAITNLFFSVPAEPIKFVKGPGAAFAHQDLIVLDVDDPGLLWPLLKGRFWPHQKILFHGQAESLAPITREFEPAQSGQDFAFYHAPPAAWLDPRHSLLPLFGPWKSAHSRLARLPSGKPWPKISVVTPSFNQGQFITETFESLFRQQYPDLEYLVLDGGSADQTREIMHHYRERFAYSCSQKDKGQADAINQGFARATGEILAWLNSDDQYAPDALRLVALAFDLFPEADVIVGGCGLLPAGSSVPNHVHHSALPLSQVVPLPLAQLLDLENCWLKGHFFYQPEVFWRKRIWDAAGGRVADDLYYCFDYDLWVRMARAGAKVLHLPDLLALYRVHSAQKTYGDNLPYLPELKLVKSRHAGSGLRAN